MRLRDRGVAVRRASAAARLGRVRPACGLRPGRALDRLVRGPRGGVPALGLLVRHRRLALVDDDAVLLSRGGGVVLAGGLAAAVAVAAVAVGEPRPLPDPAAPERR